MSFIIISLQQVELLGLSLWGQTAGCKGDRSGYGSVVVIPIADIHRGSLLALQYAKRLSSDVRALSVATSPEVKQRLEERWARFPQVTDGVKLIIVEYDYRDIMTPIVEYIEQVNNVEFPNQLTTVVIPEFVPERLIDRVMHN